MNGLGHRVALLRHLIVFSLRGLDLGFIRTHAVFRRSDGRYSVIDAGSLNGTYVNRQRVDQQELKNGDEIILGKFRLVYFDNKAVIAG